MPHTKISALNIRNQSRTKVNGKEKVIVKTLLFLKFDFFVYKNFIVNWKMKREDWHEQ